MLSFINPMLIKKILDLVPFSTKPLINNKIFTYFFLFFAALLGSYITDFTLSKIKLAFSFIFKTCEQKDLYEKLMKIKYESFCANGATYYVYRISQLINDLFMLLSSYLSSLLVALFIIVVWIFFFGVKGISVF
jgi:ABC-type multidrug transport system fused ATPase/permease subunit